jgi:hypothetical protein
MSFITHIVRIRRLRKNLNHTKVTIFNDMNFILFVAMIRGEKIAKTFSLAIKFVPKTYLESFIRFFLSLEESQDPGPRQRCVRSFLISQLQSS